MSFSLEQTDRIVAALESTAASMKSIEEKLDVLVNKSPFDDPKTKALLSAALAESGMGPEIKARGFDVDGD